MHRMRHLLGQREAQENNNLKWKRKSHQQLLLGTATRSHHLLWIRTPHLSRCLKVHNLPRNRKEVPSYNISLKVSKKLLMVSVVHLPNLSSKRQSSNHIFQRAQAPQVTKKNWMSQPTNSQHRRQTKLALSKERCKHHWKWSQRVI